MLTRVLLLLCVPLWLLSASLSRVAVVVFFVRYTNDINPFGDSNLTEQFVWGKKKEKEGTADRQLSKREIREMQKKNVDEIEKVTFGACGERAISPRGNEIQVSSRLCMIHAHIFFSCVLVREALTDWLAYVRRWCRS